jgi:MFS family permease
LNETATEERAAIGPPPLRIPPLIKRNMWFIATAQVSAGAASQLTPALGAVIVVRLAGSTGLAGAASSMLGLGRMLVAYSVGTIADRYGRKAGLYLGLFLSLNGTLMVGSSVLLSSLPLFFTGVLVFGLGSGAVSQLRVAATDMYPPSRRAEALGILLTGSLVGAFAGLGLVSLADGLGGPLSVEPLALTWFLAPAVIIPAAVLISRVHPDPREVSINLERYYPGHAIAEAKARPEVGGESGFWVFVRDYPRLTAFVSYFAVQGNMSMMMAMTSLILDHHGHGLPAISLAVAIHTVGMFAFSLPLGRLSDFIGRRWVMLLGVLIAASGSLLVVATPLYWVITSGTFLVGVGWSAVNIAAVSLIVDRTVPLERGRAIGTNDTFGGAASITMPLLAGPLAATFGLGVIGVVAVALMVLPLLLLLRLYEPKPGVYALPAPIETAAQA